MNDSTKYWSSALHNLGGSFCIYERPEDLLEEDENEITTNKAVNRVNEALDGIFF